MIVAAGLSVISGSTRKTSKAGVRFLMPKNPPANPWLSAIEFTAPTTTAMFNAALSAAERGDG